MVRKISVSIPDEVLQKDLERYRGWAIAVGATDAKIITTDMVLIDERVRAKCIYPKCHSYGTNINCPPYAMDLDMVRKVVNKFRYAIFFMLKVPSEMIAGPEVRPKRLGRPTERKIYDIASEVETEAFYDGYHLALGFAGGPCKSAFCPDTDCSALVPGQSCRHALRARSAMEGVGMNAFTMAAMVGWDIYPIGESISPSEVPHGARLGLVLIY